jgi:RHS repeat-associated protein
VLNDGTHSYTYDAENRISTVDGYLATYSGGTTYFPHVDWLGTERVRTNAAGNIAETCISLPFGDGQSCTGSDSSPTHFTGKQRDTETNLDYFDARFYSSTKGRFARPDESFADQDTGDPQSWNMYTYVVNDPLLYPIRAECRTWTPTATG